jgi:uncharacterized protein YprB with RNaseH-like and TPR domain
MSDLRSRLRNLRAVNGTNAAANRSRYNNNYGNRNEYDQHDYSMPPLPGEAQPLELLVPGDLHETPHGTTYIIRQRHAVDHEHGNGILKHWLSQNLVGAAAFTRDRRVAAIDPRRCLFLDTETTGLNGGVGTLVFLVGIGLFTDEGFEVRQYFLRNPAEEPAMLHAIHELLEQYEALITFNGRSFDVPLLATRYTLNRRHFDSDRWPNLDLLHPARRLWKRRLESCRLSSLESGILGVLRTGDDVPGWLIPQLYHEYVQNGDGRQMQRVIYHNLMDILSMVTLATQLCTIFSQPESSPLPHDDRLSLARWYESLNMTSQAEAAYLAALQSARHDADHRLILESLALLLKRQNRREDAAYYWEALAALSPSNPKPRLELAMYHEWTTGSIQQAVDWTQDAHRVISGWPSSVGKQEALSEIEHRLERLLRKF